MDMYKSILYVDNTTFRDIKLAEVSGGFISSLVSRIEINNCKFTNFRYY